MTDGHVRAESSAELAALTPAAPSLHNVSQSHAGVPQSTLGTGQSTQSSHGFERQHGPSGEGTGPACRVPVQMWQARGRWGVHKQSLPSFEIRFAIEVLRFDVATVYQQPTVAARKRSTARRTTRCCMQCHSIRRMIVHAVRCYTARSRPLWLVLCESACACSW